MATAVDLNEYVDYSNLECLNQKPSNPIANALKQGYREDDGLWTESDTDEQLLINIHFNQKVKLQSIVIKGPPDAGPRRVKLYANQVSMGFSDVDSTPCAQELEVSPAALESGAPITLKLVKFTNVTILTVFIESNQQDTETSKLTKLALNGSAADTFDVSKIKKVEDDH